ncbi:sensor histidine kinase [Phenylobacterium sp.]|uniref:sensor histidine kinase n=1 Tax=Phenylobacterium sp. TaxID=1871053 RepID=UPI00273642E8|nr:sensor histidine kinase [Phenylobacterium sp.]MDP3660457.1 sensor histidine kinase [Phenylobacterium sp.]
MASDDQTIGVAEARHRTANTLQLLAALARMRSQRSAEPEAKRQLLWLADAIGSVGGLEQKRTPAGIDFAAYLTEMAPIWRRRHGSRPAEVVLEVEPLVVPDQAASTLALIVQELVGNALTHGVPDAGGTVRIRLSRPDSESCELLVSDDGKGFDPGSAAGRERFGLWFVRSLCAQVRGEFSIDPSAGVIARLRFPFQDQGSSRS